jgi:hypothetical protein
MDVVHPDEAEDLDFDDHNEAHLARHQISPTDILQVWLNGPVWAPNRRGSAGTWLMLGDTDGGRPLTIAVVCIEAKRWLRPITGWDSTDGELTRWRQGRR